MTARFYRFWEMIFTDCKISAVKLPVKNQNLSNLIPNLKKQLTEMQQTRPVFFNNRLFLALFFILLRITVSATDKMSVIYYTDREGLPRNIVKCFVNDKFGYGWVGTGNGVARFDGYNFVTYPQLKGRNINTVVVDTKNQVWVGSDHGLFRYNRLKDSFVLIQKGYIRGLTAFRENIYFSLLDQLVKLSPDKKITNDTIKNIKAFTVTDEGIWVSGGNTGIKLLGTSVNLLKGRVISLIKEINDNLWVACRNGTLFRIDKNKQVHRIEIKNRHIILDIEQIENQLWLATDGNGIFILDKDFNFLKHLKKEQGKAAALTSNSIYDVARGMNGAIWISTYGAGLICMLPENSAFTNFVPNSKKTNSLVDKEGVSVFVDNENYYFGTNYGFSIWQKSKNRYRNITSEKLVKETKGSKVTAISATGKNIWIATYDGLMAKYSKDLKLLKTYHPCTGQENEMQRIILFNKYNENTILTGTHFKNKSLLKFDINSERFTPVIQNYTEKNHYNFQVNSIRKNQFGETIVLVRNVGIFIYNAESNSLERFVPSINKRITFNLNDFYHDKNGDYWFTTQADGLIRMSTDGRLFDKWTTEQGFPTNSLLRIESVDDHILWISTIDGLCRFDMQNGKIQIFNYRHGLASNEFLPRTSTVTPDKKIIFGNSEGFTLIDPEKLVADTSKSEVIISDISFQNKSIKRLKNEKYLKVPLEATKKIKLPFKRNSFTISFFTRDNYLPKYNNFEYRLVGLEKDWIYLGAHNETTYTNLSPGKYLFKVRSTNKSNVWNENPTTIEIRILPPWYLTWIAFVAYFIFIVVIIIVIFRIYANRVQLKKEVEISQFKIKSEHELTEKKLAFFTNISHDLKTPLTLISAPINDLLQSDNLKKEQIKKLDVAKRNTARLYKLISDLVDFRRITQNQLPLRTQLTDLKPVIENIFESFKVECDKQDIDFSYRFNLNEPIFIDVKKIEKILWNLLANALKFTEKGGKIWLTIDSVERENDRFLKVEVGDTGKGFTSKEKKKIFDRFYQVRESETIRLDSSGIGLSIVNDLVKIHHGEIQVDSEPGKGSVFTIILPVEEKYYREEEKWEAANLTQKETVTNNKPLLFTNDTNENEKPDGKKYSLQKLLIVEDNQELREYLASHFSTSFKVYQAAEGKEGVKLAKEKEPNLIITDIEMPEMNGYEFTKKIRSEFSTSHIPIVMLTANSATEQKVKGMEAGADSYVTKPFEIQYLDAVIKALLENRKRVQERFMGIEPVKENLNNLTEADIKFVDDLRSFVLKNISNEALNIDLLSSHFSISRTQLNRKIKALTNYTPNNYIRLIRLKKAYELIKNQGVRVSEAAYLTGFTDPNYFTICFTKEFGKNPSKIKSTKNICN